MAKLVRVIDGDTIVVDIDLGLKQWSHSVHLRIKDLWCPETRTKDLEEKQRGLAAKSFLEEMLFDEYMLKVRTYKASFDRYVADVWFANAGGEHSVATKMIEAGHGTAEKPD
jgi:micrococcal nuclease